MSNLMPAFIARTLAVQTSDPDVQRRGWLLNILLWISAALLEILMAINGFELSRQPTSAARPDAGSVILFDLLSVLFMLGLAALNRRGRTRLAAIGFLVASVGSCTLFFDMKVLDRVLLVYAIPILASSFIVAPSSSFIVAALSGLAYTLMFLRGPTPVNYNYISMLSLVLMAVLAWLAAVSVEKALGATRRSLIREQTIQDRLRAEVAERTQAEAAQRASEERLLTVLSAAPIFLFATDSTGVVTLLKGKGLAAILLIDPDQLIGRSVFDPHYQVPEPFRADIRRALTGESFTNTVELLGRAFEMWYSAHRDEQGCVTEVIGVATDITERLRAEAALDQERRLLRTVIDNLPDQIFARDVDCRFILNNRSDALAMGLADPETLLGKSDYDVYPSELAARYQVDNRRVMETGQPLLNYEEPSAVQADGRQRWTLTTKVPLRDGQGRVIGIVGIAHDITEHKRVEEALRASELKFRSVIEQSYDGIFLADEQGAIVEWNVGEEQITGLRREQALGQALWDIQGRLAMPQYQTSEFRRQLRDTIRHALQVRQAPWFNQLQEHEIQRPDGTSRMIEALIYPIHIEGRFALGGVMRDITDRKRAEAALRESEKRYRTLMETSPDPIALLDLNGNFVMTNPRAVELYQFASAEAMLGTNAFDLIVPEERQRARASLLTMLQTGVGRSGEYRMLRQDGSRFSAELTVATVTDSAGKPQASIVVARDISERKHAELALRDSEERYRALMETSPDPITVVDLNGNFTMVNRRAVELHGFASAREMIGTNAFNLIAPEDHARAQADIRKALEIGRVQGLEYTMLHRDGTRIPAEMSASVIADATGNPIGLSGVTRDITDRKRAARALERRATQLALLNDVGSQIAAVLDLDKVLDTATHLAQDSFGYSHVALFMLDREQHELIMKVRADKVVTQTPPVYHFKLAQGIVGWVGSHGEKLLCADVRAEPRYLNLYPDRVPTLSELCVPLQVGAETIGVLDVQSPQLNAFDENDVMAMETLANQIATAIENARLYGAVQRELAERQRTEAELKRRNEDLIALNAVAMALSQVAGLDDVLSMALDTVLKITRARVGTIQLCDEDSGQITHTIQRGTAQTGSEDAGSKHVRDNAVSEVLHTGQPLMLGTDVAVYRSHLEPDRAWLHPCAAVLIKSKSKVLGVMMLEGEMVRRLASQDVQLLTAIGHEIGTALENARLVSTTAEVQVLREVDRLRSELIANVSHELRTPLGLIKLFSTALLAEGFEFDRETQQEFLTEIDQETERLEQLVNNLLDVSRIQNGRLRLSKQATDLAQLTREAVKRARLPDIPHEFVLDVPAGAVMAVVDPLRIEQVLRNLLNNAVKYSPAGGCITVRLHGDARQILLSVSDEGLGIPSNDLAQVFDRFYRVENELTQTVAGVGLGLAVSRGIVEAHSGRIWVESQPGAGSHFYVSLPVGELAAAEAALPGARS